MSYAARDVASVLNCSASARPDLTIAHLAFDSRRISQPQETLFFGIIGKQHDGHKYVAQAYQLGVRNFVVQEVESIRQEADANYMVVADSVRALQQLATYHRNQFDIPVIGITGSNGKTTVKEWLHQVLSPDFKIVRSPNSYNSQIGVPVSVWEMSSRDDLAIFEAGISQRGEMERLQPVIRPTIGLITNIGPAHDEGFSSRSEKLAEKLKLFSSSEVVICCRDQEMVFEAIQDQLDVTVFTWGEHEDSDVRVDRVELIGAEAELTVQYRERLHTLRLPFSDQVGIENVCHVLAVYSCLDLPLTAFQGRVQELQRVELRLEMKDGLDGGLLIYDCYNADLKSLEVALDFLDVQARDLPKAAVLTDLLETGMTPDLLYREISQTLTQHGIKRVIGIGEQIERLHDILPTNGIQFTHVSDTEAFLNAGLADELKGYAVLLKGARKFRVERIGKALERQAHGTVLEINLSSLVHNLRIYREKLSPHVKVMGMVKAFSYGSGTYEIANVLQYHQIDYLAVAFVDEGIHLREQHISLPIMVMNPEPGQMELFRKFNLEPEIYSFDLLDEALAPSNETLRIHLKVDTGMHRLGFSPDDADRIGQMLDSDSVEVVSVFTHLAAADESTHDEFTRQQVKRYELFYENLIKHLGYRPLRHVLNSSGISRFPDYQMNMVRLGIGMYGVDPSSKMQEQLRPVARLFTTVSQVREVASGESVGYSRAGTVAATKRVATVGIGYADGYRRVLSNGRGGMMINGKEAPVIGNVCMDMTMLDVTGLPDVQPGDQVEVFGLAQSISEVAHQAQTIPYEILSGISQRVKRTYIEE